MRSETDVEWSGAAEKKDGVIGAAVWATKKRTVMSTDVITTIGAFGWEFTHLDRMSQTMKVVYTS